MEEESKVSSEFPFNTFSTSYNLCRVCTNYGERTLPRNVAFSNTQKYLQHGDWELAVEFSISQEVTQILIFTHKSLKEISIL